ncbi:hypothetical protein K492DRAFT_211014 [Lichtheimia hyalospora FSU 10163]|nr:hypothetical protein K492DRAFT_211014 [Lichtheimia hyalospora FSU 10163]
MSVDILKEKFAFATTIQERQDAIRQHAVAESVDWYYYHGLVLLQQLYECVPKQSGDTRDPTSQEKELMDSIRQHLRTFQRQFPTGGHEQLRARFQLLSYSINTAESVEYIRDRLGIRSIVSNTSNNTSTTAAEDAGTPIPSSSGPDNMYPTKLDQALIDPNTVVKHALRHNNTSINLLLLPSSLQLDEDHENLLSLLTEKLPQHRSNHLVTLANALKENHGDSQSENFSFAELTLEQLDKLHEIYPAVADDYDAYLSAYLSKLVDNHPKEYTKLWEFIKTLKEDYTIKRHILSCLLQDKILQDDYDMDLFKTYFEVVQLCRGSHGQPRLPQIPVLPVPKVSHNDIISEFLAGALLKDAQGTSDKIREWPHYKSELENLHAELLIQQQPTHAWAQQILGSHGIKDISSRVELSFPRFTTKLYYETHPLMPTDPIRLTVRIKNVKHVSVRAYQLDLFQYWRRVQHRQHNKNLQVNDINLDGLCPTWETDLDFSNASPLERIDKTWVLDDATIFSGRGAWVIDVVGGRENCRAIVQKGRLRHLVKDTSAGHLFRILDEHNQPVNAKLWINNMYYESDDQCNILIPYRDASGDEKAQALIVTEEDGYCEPVQFTWKKEEYTLVADFHVHSESLVANKQSKVVVVPRLMIHGQPVSLDLLESVGLTIEAMNANQIKSTFTKEKLQVARNQPIEMDFTVPSSLSSLSFMLRGKVKTTSTKTPLQDVEVSETTRLQNATDSITSAYLRIKNDGEYIIQMLGRNGEPQKGVVVNLGLQHSMVEETINVNLQSDQQGVVELGKLKHITGISLYTPVSKTWDLVPDATQSRLPSVIYHAANKPFHLAYPQGDDQCCTLFQYGEHGHVLHDLTDKINVTSDSINVPEGLAAGRYRFYLSTSASYGKNVCFGVQQVDCTIIDAASSDTSSSPHWSDWLVSPRIFAQSTGLPITSPMGIENLELTENQLVIKLNNCPASNTVALLSTTAFVPERGSNTTRSLVYDQSITETAMIKTSVDTFAAFLEGRKLSEEFQYILNRSRAEKYVGSSLTKPSLVIYPKESHLTRSEPRYLEGEEPHQSVDGFCDEADGITARNAAPLYSSAPCIDASWDMNFLNHATPTLVLLPDEQGKLVLDRSQLGNGNLLHITIHQNKQAVTKQIVLPDVSMDLNCQNMCHQADHDVSIAYVRTKSVSTLTPSSSLDLTIGQHEWETIHTFEKIFDQLDNMTSCNLRDFEFLKKWPSMTVSQKSKHHREKVCHELNLWIKHRDPAYFDEHIKPFIKCKLNKSFMDLYLVDEDLSAYTTDLYMYQKLTTIEKALLAKRVPEMVPVVVQAFKDAYEPPSETTVDRRFDTILGGSVLDAASMAQTMMMECAYAAPPPPAATAYLGRATGRAAGFALKSAMRHRKISEVESEEEESDDDMGFAMFDGEDDESFDNLAGAGDENDENDKNDEDDMFMEEEALRELLKKRTTKVPYTFAKATREWCEKGYYNDDIPFVPVNQFWIDYLEHASGPFLSSNFIYASDELSEVMAILTLMELPFQTDAQIKEESNLEAARFTIRAETPCLVYYRAIKQAENPPPSNPSILLGQGFFVKKDALGNELDMVDPNALRPSVDYGWHLAISNISSKKCIAEVTCQVPLGAIPTNNTAYFQSRTIQVEPYSTWRNIVGSFYFPECGEYKHAPVTVSRSSTLLGQTQLVNITVSIADEDVIMEEASGSSSNASWAALVANSKDDTKILDYLETKANLQKIDMSLLGWRMHQQEFAKQVLQLLRKRRFFSHELWQYGLYHRFPDAIQELILQSGQSLVNRCGGVIESPLVTFKDMPKTLDYDPMMTARAHPIGNINNISNCALFDQYNELLIYLCQLQQASASDLIMLTTYLILQERIGDAQVIYKQLCDMNPPPSIQMDYLNAYLQTRIRVEDAADGAKTLDMDAVRTLVNKHKTCSNEKWQQLFVRLEEFINQVEQPASLAAGTEPTQQQPLPEGPVLDFSIGNEGKLTLNYANVNQVNIRYYKMDVEVMFSMNPFMGQQQSVRYDWIKPTMVQTVICPPDTKEATTKEDDFAMIGVGKVATCTLTVDLPETLLNANAMVQVTTSDSTLERRKAHFSNDLACHFIEGYGIVRVAAKQTGRPLAGTYVKVYAKLETSQGGRVEFWKDGYTGLNGVFDYVTVTDGNSLVSRRNHQLPDNILEQAVERVEKFSLLIQSAQHGALVEEIYPPAL